MGGQGGDNGSTSSVRLLQDTINGGSPDDRIRLWDAGHGRAVGGRAAPYRRNLSAFLADRPKLSVYDNQDGKKSDLITGISSKAVKKPKAPNGKGTNHVATTKVAPAPKNPGKQRLHEQIPPTANGQKQVPRESHKRKRPLSAYSSGIGAEAFEGLTPEEAVLVDERAYQRSLRDRSRYAQRERAETVQFKHERARLLAIEQMFGKRYRSAAVIAEDEEMNRFLDKAIIIEEDEPPRSHTRSKVKGSSNGKSVADEPPHDLDECHICGMGRLLCVEELEGGAGDVGGSSTSNGTGAGHSGNVCNGGKSAGGELWIPWFGEVSRRKSQNRQASANFLARYKRSLLGDDEEAMVGGSSRRNDDEEEETIASFKESLGASKHHKGNGGSSSNGNHHSKTNGSSHSHANKNKDAKRSQKKKVTTPPVMPIPKQAPPPPQPMTSPTRVSSRQGKGQRVQPVLNIAPPAPPLPTACVERKATLRHPASAPASPRLRSGSAHLDNGKGSDHMEEGRASKRLKVSAPEPSHVEKTEGKKVHATQKKTSTPSSPSHASASVKGEVKPAAKPTPPVDNNQSLALGRPRRLSAGVHPIHGVTVSRPATVPLEQPKAPTASAKPPPVPRVVIVHTTGESVAETRTKRSNAGKRGPSSPTSAAVAPSKIAPVKCAPPAPPAGGTTNSSGDDLPQVSRRELICGLSGNRVKCNGTGPYAEKMSEGVIEGPGIRCDCCKKLFSVSEWAKHINNNLHTPYHSIMLKKGGMSLQAAVGGDDVR